MTMLEVLEGRLVDGLEISSVKERRSEFVITFSYGGLIEKGFLPKTCAPGAQDRVADRTIFNTMASFAFRRNDLDDVRCWLDKIQDLGKSHSA